MLDAQYEKFLKALLNIIPRERVYTDPLRTMAYGSDASVYRMNPKIVLDVESEAEVSRLLRLAARHRVGVTFRAAGTSLSGQAVTDSVLMRLGRGWRDCKVGKDATCVTMRPGLVGAEANRILSPFGRKIGPDPGSIDACFIGGMVANNASGMCCGTSDNSYKTVLETRMILADGTLLDTGDAVSRAEFSRTRGHILRGLAALRARVLADEALAGRIRRKFKIKNTTGYSLNALVDYDDPFEILQHLLVGSEGTLGFIAEVTQRTVLEHPCKASALLLFPSVAAACEAVIALKSMPVSAVELMDRASLRSVEGRPGLPPGLETLGNDVCSLLVETRAADHAALSAQLEQITQALKGHPTAHPEVCSGAFSADPAVYEPLWKIRKGILPAVGAMRPKGTSMVIEDVAFPVARLAQAAVDLQGLFAKYGYGEAGAGMCPAPIFGHALEGNLHFVFTQDFGNADEVARYSAFMDEICRLVVEKYDGSLKAEHGTGRNIAPFVELEWGRDAYALMKEIKALLDPLNILNPGVVLNDDPEAHLKYLKSSPALTDEAGLIVDKCTECGFCEPTCTAAPLSLSPRQRIVAYREISRLKSLTPQDFYAERIKEMEKSFNYLGQATCAADGLCGTVCPAQINTGDFIKKLRQKKAGLLARNSARLIAKKFAPVIQGGALALSGVHGVHRLVGTKVMESGSRLLRAVSFNKIPAWNPSMPSGGKNPAGIAMPIELAASELKVVYFPSCVSRAMGPGAEHHDRRTEAEAMLSLLFRAGYDVIFPENLAGLCCGMAFASKGYPEEGLAKCAELERALRKASLDGRYPILTETSPCLLFMKDHFAPGLELYEPIRFILERLKDRLDFRRLPRKVAVHATCSTRKMGLGDKLAELARLCAEEVVVPEGVNCCGFAGDRGFTHPELNATALRDLRAQVRDCSEGYSTSRTCQIGLSLHGGIPYYSVVFLADEATRG